MPCLHVGPYKDTVNLPQTSFNMRANSAQREPQIQKFWQDNKVYESCLADDTKVLQAPIAVNPESCAADSH